MNAAFDEVGGTSSGTVRGGFDEVGGTSLDTVRGGFDEVGGTSSRARWQLVACLLIALVVGPAASADEVGGTSSSSTSSSTVQSASDEMGGTSSDASSTVQSASDEVGGTSSDGLSPSHHPPLILISIDTLRSDRLPAYGYDGVKTPAIDRLRDDGVLFEHAYSHIPLTLPSHLSMLTGQRPPQHGVRDNQGYPFVPDPDYLPLRLRRHGYTTLAAVSAYVLHRQSGLAGDLDAADRGASAFDEFDDQLEIDPSSRTLGGIDRSAQQTLDGVEPWLSQYRDDPFFLLVHFFEPHLPHTPPEPFLGRYGATYEGEIATVDAAVGRLLRRLDALGLYRRALIVLTSDHGEGLGDHGEEEHGIFLYREALQVPLLLKLPGNLRAGERVGSAVQLSDVYPTLLRGAGLDPQRQDAPVGALADDPGAPRALQDVSDSDPPRAIYSETYYPRLHYGWHELTSLVLDRHHLIAGPAPELFHLIEDPEEQHNLLPQARRRAGELRDVLLTLQNDLEAPGEVDAETRQRLAALGYLSASPTTEAKGRLPDPKSQLPSLELLRQASAARARGDLSAAIAAMSQLLEANPRIVDAWHALGDTLRQAGRFTEAADAYSQALELTADPEFLTLAGRAHEELSLAALERNDWTGARNAAQQAVELDDGLASAWNNLGVARWYLGETSLALEAWTRAVEIDPQAWDTLFNLGLKSMELERQNVARDSLRRFIAGAPAMEYGPQIRRARVLLRRLER